jgi:predicted RecB family nuclease
LGILEKNIDILGKSRAYPYGLTADKIARLKEVGIETIQTLWETTDARLQEIDGVGPAAIKRMRDVMQQAIWM